MEEETKETRDLKGALITGIVGVILAVLLMVAHQVIWGVLTLVLVAAIVWHILHQPAAKPGLPSDRATITELEQKNGHLPLDWEPITSASAAESLLTEKVGDFGWHTESGTVAVSSPIQFVVTSQDGQRYVVFATGEYTAAPVEGQANTETSADKTVAASETSANDAAAAAPAPSDLAEATSTQRESEVK